MASKGQDEIKKEKELEQYGVWVKAGPEEIEIEESHDVEDDFLLHDPDTDDPETGGIHTIAEEEGELPGSLEKELDINESPLEDSESDGIEALDEPDELNLAIDNSVSEGQNAAESETFDMPLDMEIEDDVTEIDSIDNTEDKKGITGEKTEMDSSTGDDLELEDIDLDDLDVELEDLEFEDLNQVENASPENTAMLKILPMETLTTMTLIST